MAAAAVFDGVLARGRVREAVGDRAWLQAMLDFEAALARAEARAGLLGPGAAAAIAAACRAEDFDVARVGRGGARAGNPAEPVVRALTAAVKSATNDAAAGHVHRGATSQDVLDTAMMLVAHRALRFLLEDLEGAADAAAALAARHRATLATGRTLLQQALPITFGLKAAGWLSGLDEAAALLARFATRGWRCSSAAPPAPWPRSATPDRPCWRTSPGAGPARAHAALAHGPRSRRRAGGRAGRRRRGDRQGRARRDAAGARTRSARSASAAMAAARRRCRTSAIRWRRSARSPARRARAGPGGDAAGDRPCKEHQRAAGAWQAEWRPFRELFETVGSAAAWLRDGLEHLEVDEARLRADLDATGGLLLAERVTGALAPALGRLAAHDLVAAACAEVAATGRSLAEVLVARPEVAQRLAPEEIARLLEPAGYLGSAGLFVDRALAAHAARRAPGRRGP